MHVRQGKGSGGMRDSDINPPTARRASIALNAPKGISIDVAVRTAVTSSIKIIYVVRPNICWILVQALQIDSQAIGRIAPGLRNWGPVLPAGAVNLYWPN